MPRAVVTVPCRNGERRWVVCFVAEYEVKRGSSSLRTLVSFASGPPRSLLLGAFSTAAALCRQNERIPVYSRGTWHVPHEIPGHREAVLEDCERKSDLLRHVNKTSGTLLDARTYVRQLEHREPGAGIASARLR